MDDERRKWKPPLARELFSADREHYFNILRRYQGALVLAADLASASKATDFNLEKKLLEYSKHHDERMRTNFKEIPCYLKDLIWQVTSSYVDVPGSYVVLAKRLIVDTHHVVTFVTLNYDTLLEHALNTLFRTNIISDMAHYINPNGHCMIIKVHGSIDWVTPMAGHGGNWNQALRQFQERGGQIILDPGKASRHVTQIDHETGFFWYPVLTAPLAGKGPMDLVCPREHLERLVSSLSRSDKFLIIGTSARDDDLLSLLAASVARKDCFVQCVSSGDVSNVRKALLTQVPQWREATFRTFNEGFATYLSRGEFEEFLSA